jgi:hypothetical protein
MDCDMLPDPAAVIEILDVLGGVTGWEEDDPPPQATREVVDARPAIRRTIPSERLANGPRRLLFQKRMRAEKQAGSPAMEASSAGVAADGGGCSPDIDVAEPSVVIVMVEVTGVFDPSAVSVAGEKVQAAF